MNRMTFKNDNNGKNYARISKKAAEKAYINGMTIVLCPCNMQPFGMWHVGYMVNRKAREEFCLDFKGAKKDFVDLVDSYSYYNCRDGMGRYISFYVEEV